MKNLIHKLGLGMMVISSILTTSCSDNDEPTIKPFTPRKNIQLSAQENVVKDHANRFAFNIWQENLQSPEIEKRLNDNLVMSPYALFINLSTVANGARGESYEQVMDLLCNDTSAEAIHMLNSYNRHMMNELKDADSSVTFAIEQMFAEDVATYPVRPEFVDLCSNYYNLSYFPFAYPEEADGLDYLQKIYVDWYNSFPFVTKITKPHDECINGGINTICYLSGTWTSEFSKENTKESTFTNREGTKKSVQMMNAEHIMAQVASTQDATLCALPFGNGQYEMVFVLPDTGKDVWSCMTTEILNPSKEGWREQSMSLVSIPKFDISNLFEPYLQHLDIIEVDSYTILFHGDLSGMFEGKEHGMCPKQYTMLTVNESGAKAESVTMGYDNTWMSPVGSSFVLNRPFLFLIRETSTGAILFMGCVNDPTATL